MAASLEMKQSTLTISRPSNVSRFWTPPTSNLETAGLEVSKLGASFSRASRLSALNDSQQRVVSGIGNTILRCRGDCKATG